MSCHQCANPLAKGIHTCNRAPFNLEFDLLKSQADRYREALEQALTFNQVTHIHTLIREYLKK